MNDPPRDSSFSRPLTFSGATPTCIELAFSVFMNKFTGVDAGSVAAIQLDDANSVSLWVSANTISVVEQEIDGDQFKTVGSADVAIRAWHSVRVRYSVGASSPIELFIDRKPVKVTSVNIVKGSPKELLFGAGFTRQDVTTQYWLDDVRVR